VNWQVKTGERSVLGVGSAMDIVLGRLEYLAQHGSRCNQEKLLGEAIEYARFLRGWIREHEPRVDLKQWTCDGSIESQSRQVLRAGGKAGPMSDG
jgi:hypothetical protein